jgi:hypothetical protein
MKKQELESFVVRNTDGTINHEVSALNFIRELKVYEKTSFINKEDILAKMNECFDKTPGITIAKFKAHMLSKLHVSLSNFTAYDKAISEVLKSNSGEWETGAMFYTSPGVNGGTFRWSDANNSKIDASIARVKKAKEEVEIKKSLLKK